MIAPFAGAVTVEYVVPTAKFPNTFKAFVALRVALGPIVTLPPVLATKTFVVDTLSIV